MILIAKWEQNSDQITIEKPILKFEKVATYTYDFSLDYFKYMNGENGYTINCFELYMIEPTGKYKYLSSGQAGGTTWCKLVPGNEYKFTAKAYVIIDGTKYYSNYSNEVIIK